MDRIWLWGRGGHERDSPTPTLGTEVLEKCYRFRHGKYHIKL